MAGAVSWSVRVTDEDGMGQVLYIVRSPIRARRVFTREVRMAKTTGAFVELLDEENRTVRTTARVTSEVI